MAHPNDLLRWAFSPYNDRLVPGGGEHAASRETSIQSGSIAMTSGLIRLRFFTAMVTETITKIRTWSGDVAAAATPTLCKVGVYEVNDTTGDLSGLVASANTTSLWAGTDTQYTTTLSANFNKVAGKRYAAAAICVTAGTVPQLCGGTPVGFGSGNLVQRLLPTVAAVRSGQTDLPATIAESAFASLGFLQYTPAFAFIP